MKYSAIWKKLFVIWIALGIAIAGYFYSFPKKKPKDTFSIELVNDYSIAKICLVITVVGGVLIGGFGKISVEKKEDNE